MAHRHLPSGLLFFYKNTSQTLSFCLRAVKFLQPQHKGRLHTQYEFQDGATSRADAILIFRGVSLSVVHCMLPINYIFKICLFSVVF